MEKERFIKSEHAVRKEDNERSDKAESTAIEVLKIVQASFKDQPTSDEVFLQRAERVWRWVTMDGMMPLPEDQPKDSPAN